MRRARLERRLTEEELAEIVGLHRTHVGSVERGERNVSVDNMEAIAQALEEKVSDLLREKS
jgi:transcriptional regulator with XRE-family HTH domain